MMGGAKTTGPGDAPSPKSRQGRTGVLLVNLGTPEAPTPGAVRAYLAEFLSDKRVIDLPRILWAPLLHGIILNVRPAATARKYKKIWREESNESPLRYFTRAQAGALARSFRGDVVIDWAMRYGAPSILERMRPLMDAGCARILIVPLYPQYSATTNASVADAVSLALNDLARPPEVKIAPAFHDEPAYIEALAAVTRARLSSLDWAPSRMMISFHSLPQRYVDAGDPYREQCAQTALLLRNAMGWTENFAPMAFQSKFGREKWLEPATAPAINQLAAEGVKNIAVITPGFVSDCIETLEEIGIVARDAFLRAGGENFDIIPCLNHAPEMTALLETITRRELAGWV